MKHWAGSQKNEDKGNLKQVSHVSNDTCFLNEKWEVKKKCHLSGVITVVRKCLTGSLIERF